MQVISSLLVDIEESLSVQDDSHGDPDETCSAEAIVATTARRTNRNMVDLEVAMAYWMCMSGQVFRFKEKNSKDGRWVW